MFDLDRRQFILVIFMQSIYSAVRWLVCLVYVQVSTFNSQLQAQNGPGFAWVLFDKFADVTDGPKATSSREFTLTDTDTSRVCNDASLLLSLNL